MAEGATAEGAWWEAFPEAKAGTDTAGRWWDSYPLETEIKSKADPILDAILQFVDKVPRGMVGSLDTAKMLTPTYGIGRGVEALAKAFKGNPVADTVAFGAKRLQGPELKQGLDEIIPPLEAETRAGRYAGTVGDVIGGSVLPGAGWMGAAQGIARNVGTGAARGVMGRMLERAAEATVANPGRAAALDLMSATTSGLSMERAKEGGAGPVGQTIAGIAGGFVPSLPALATAPIQRARVAAANQGRTGAYNRMVSQLPEQDIDLLANQVATGAGRNNQVIQRRTLDILGEEMERAGGNRIDARESAVRRIMRETGVAESTARDQIRRLTAVHAASPLMMAEYPAAAPSNALVRSTRNPDLRDVARQADVNAHMVIDDLANSPGGAAPIVRNAVNERNRGMRDVTREGLQDLAPRAPGGGGPRTIQDLDQMQEGARRASGLEYEAAYQGATNNRILVGLLPRIIERHRNRQFGRSGEQADALNRAINEFFIQTPQGQTIPMMSLQMLQDARGTVRGMIERARRAGEDHIVGTLQPLYRDVTRMMERANPTWAVANRRWADGAINDRARELGEAFSLRAGPQYRQQVRDFQALAPEAQDMVRVEFLQKVFDKLDNLGDGHDVAKLFTTDHMRNAIRELFGPQAAIEVARLSRDAAIATRSGRALAGSQTHMRGMRQREADAETGILAAMDARSPRKFMDQVWERLAGFLADRRNRPLAEIATTPMQDVAEVARHIHNMRVADRHRRAVETVRRNPAPYGVTGLSATQAAQEQR